MKTLNSSYTCNMKGLLLVCLLLAPSMACAQEAVGEIIFALGEVEVRSDERPTRQAEGGAPIFNGDSIITERGRAQLKMEDETFISVQPDSNYKIENYKFEEDEPDTMSAVFSLVKGGVRAVTGAIGKLKKEAYKVNTPVATIGIRGTGHNTRICQGDCPGKEDGLYHSTWSGVTYVSNGSGSRDVPTGKAVFVRDPDASIEELNQIPAVTSVQGLDSTGEEEEYLVGEQLDPSGNPEIIPEDEIAPQLAFLENQVTAGMENLSMFNLDVLLAEQTTIFRDGLPIGFLATEVDFPGNVLGRALGTIDPEALLTIGNPEIDSLLGQVPDSDLELVQSNPASVADYNVDNGTAWGRWTDGYILVAGTDGNGSGYRTNLLENNQSLHFVTGPAPENIPNSGSARYAFTGGTPSTSADGSTIGMGVTSGQLDVFFGTSTASLTMNVNHMNIDHPIDGQLNIASNLLSDNNEIFINPSDVGSTGLCGSGDGCQVYISGQFIGPNLDSGQPRDAGLNYNIEPTSGPSPDSFGGVAVFRTDGSPVPQ